MVQKTELSHLVLKTKHKTNTGYPKRSSFMLHPTSLTGYPFSTPHQNPTAPIAFMPLLLSSIIIGFASSNPLSLQQQQNECHNKAYE